MHVIAADQFGERHCFIICFVSIFSCQSDTYSDYVELSNFNVELTDRKMSRLCGSRGTTPLPLGMTSAYNSDGSFFRVTFRSNDAYDATGFEALYQFRPISG
jgi:hypothetical protein